MRVGRAPGRTFLLAAAALLLLAVSVLAQRVPERRLERPIDFSTSQDDNLFSLVRSQDFIHEWDQALGELEAGAHEAAVERLHRLLQIENAGVVPVSPGRFLGLHLAVVTTMANISPAAEQAYEVTVRREAGSLLDHPLWELGFDQLTQLAERFPTASIGRQARLHLGDLAFEKGDAVAAIRHYRRALDAMRIGSDDERRTAARLECAQALIDPRTARNRAEKNRLFEGAEDVLSILPRSSDPTWYPAIGGGGDGRTPMSAPAGKPQAQRTEDVVAVGFDQREIGQFAMFPVGDLDGIFVNTGREMIAFDPLRKTRAWESPTPMREHDPGGWSSDPHQQINHDMVLACACGGDLVVGALQVPDKSQNVDFQQSFRIISKIPVRRLFAFSRRTGKLVWSHFDELDGSRTRFFRGHDACGPPIIVGDTVYAPIHDRSGAIAFAVAAYDLQTGKPKWRQLVCSSQQDVNMFGNARMEFAASPLAITGGVIYGATNLGVTYALDAPSGRVRWISAYEVVRMPRAMLHNQADRNIYFANNAPVVADGVVCFTPLDSAFVLGIDAETGRQLWRLPAEARVGGVDNGVAWLAGALDAEFVLAGKGAIAVRARPDALLGPQPPNPQTQPQVRQLVRPEQLAERGDDLLQPRPAVTANHVWFARVDRIFGFDRTGAPVPRADQIDARHLLPGNLLLIDGIVVSLRQRALDILFDPPALQQRVEDQLKETPDDPAMILRLASLLGALPADNSPPLAEDPATTPPPGSASPKPPPQSLADRILALYRRGLEACQKQGLAKNHPVRQALQRELFERARSTATRAIDLGDRRALELVIDAREAAPDTASWIEMQSLVLARSKSDPERMRAELDRLEQTAGDANFPPGDDVPVRAWLLWQRALLAETTPATAVLLWQQLLEQFGRVPLPDGAAAGVAQAAIERLIAAHGAAIYAPIAARAEAAAAAAGDNMQALQDVGLRFPNSPTAKKARTQLLDLSVQKGDLVVACDVLAQSLRTGPAAPGILRRVLVAALARGNRGLARAMAARLELHAGETSDWPADKGATYRTVLDALQPQLATESSIPPLAVPRDEIARIAPRTPRELLQLVSVLRPAGFEALPDEPLFVKTTTNDLLAYDVLASGDRKPILFQLPIEYLEDPVGIVVCGDTVVVPDLERVFAVNYRTGALRWELPNQKRRILDCLGVQQGVVHLFAQASVQDGNSDLIGIEPLSGSILFTRTLPGTHLRPKPVPGQLVVMELDSNGGARIHRLDPVTGLTEQTIPIAASVVRSHLRLQPDSLALGLYPQGICADRERVFLPVDSAQPSDTPSLVAIDAAGQVSWQWRGHLGNKLLMTASHGDHIVVVEGSEQRPGQVVLLSGKDGSVVRAIELGANVLILNWSSSWLVNESPPIIAFCDLVDRSRRRVVCFSVDGGGPTFEVPLTSEDGQVTPQALFGADFVTFGVRAAQQNDPFRLYSLHLRDRSGALSDGNRFRRLDRAVGRTHGLGAAGPYTVIGGSQSLLVLGDKAPKK